MTAEERKVMEAESRERNKFARDTNGTRIFLEDTIVWTTGGRCAEIRMGSVVKIHKPTGNQYWIHKLDVKDLADGKISYGISDNDRRMLVGDCLHRYRMAHFEREARRS